jgi:YggT family protein
MLSALVYPIISLIVFWAMIIFVAIMGLRLFFSFSDPNPFGAVGRFAYRLRKATDRYVQPFADFLFMWRIDRRYAPILTALIFGILAYFGLQIIGNTLFIIDGLVLSSASGNVKAIIGFVLYAFLSLYILFIFVRILSSWFVFGRRSFFGFVRRVTDPVMIPFQKLIPPVGMFDISAMILLILLQLLQTFVLRAFVF